MAQNEFKKGFDHLKSQDKNNDRAALAAHYEQELRDKEKMARELRAQQLREADGVKERIDAINAHENHMAKDKAQRVRNETEAMMQWNDQRKSDALTAKQNEDRYYAGCAREADQKRRDKEEALAEYFRQLNQHQDQKYKDYLNNVTVPDNMKMAERLMREERERQEKLRIYDKDQADRNEKSSMVNNGFVEANQILQQKRGHQINSQKAVDQAEANMANQMQRIDQEMYNQDQKDLHDKKNIYKQTLLYQQAMKDKAQHNFGKMTKQEKNLNKMDLNAFRNQDTNMFSMVPGINNFNTVGTHPMIRSEKPLELATARSMDVLPKLYNNFEDHPIKDQIYNRKTHTRNGSHAIADPLYNPNQRLDTPQTMKKNQVYVGYNPVTNPMPQGGINTNLRLEAEKRKLNNTYGKGTQFQQIAQKNVHL